MVPIFTTATALTAAGNTADVPVVGAQNFVVQAVVSSIGTNVVFRVEGSLDGTNYFNLSAANTTVTANGSTAFYVTNCPLRFIRGVFVSNSGGSPSLQFVFSAMPAGS